jgi:hypothetical protein
MNKPGNSVFKKVIAAICVIAPIAALAAFMINRFGNINLSGLLPYALLLLCPLSHLLMMPFMHKMMNKNGEGKDDNSKNCH